MTYNSSENQPEGIRNGQLAYSAPIEENPFVKFLPMVANEKSAIGLAIANILAEIGSEKNTLLEVGAGTGATLKYYAHEFQNIILVESSAKFVELLRDMAVWEVMHATFEDLELTFQPDYVMASHVMRYMADPLLQVERMIEAITENGRVIITMSDTDSAYSKFIEEFEKFGHNDHEFSVAEIEEYLQANGIDYEAKQIFSNFTALSAEDIIAVLPVVLSIDPATLTEEQLDEIRLYLQQFQADDGIDMPVGHTILVIKKPN